MTGIGVDTNLLIDFFKGKKEAVAFVEKHARLLVISELVVVEFLCGNLSQKQQDAFLEAIAPLRAVPLGREGSLHAAQVYRDALRKGRTASRADAMIAGSYLAAGVTRISTRDKGFPGMKVVMY